MRRAFLCPVQWMKQPVIVFMMRTKSRRREPQIREKSGYQKEYQSSCTIFQLADHYQPAPGAHSMTGIGSVTIDDHSLFPPVRSVSDTKETDAPLQPLFVTTRWSVVLAAQDKSSPDSAAALETLC